jgi:hypothetical protein
VHNEVDANAINLRCNLVVTRFIFFPNF